LVDQTKQHKDILRILDILQRPLVGLVDQTGRSSAHQTRRN